MNLSTCSLGRDAQIVGLDVEPGLGLRMSELGLRVGAVVRVVQHGGASGRVVAVGADRLFLDLDACRSVRLAPAW